MTPSILASLTTDSYEKLTHIFLGGEAPSPALIRDWTANGQRRLFNGYGPTEATCGCLMGELKANGPITAGWPIPSSEILLVDRDGQLADEGEIHIGGPILSPGYYENDELTQRAFVEINGKRYFKSRDWAMRTEAGYKICGRIDDVVKNRGFLVNLSGDVERALSNDDAVHTAVALQHDGRLWGFVTPQRAGEDSQLRRRLLDRHPAYHVPDRIVGLDSLPLTSNGKADVRALLQMAASKGSLSSAEARPRTVTSQQELLYNTMAEILAVSSSSVNSNTSFLAAGGNSLAALQLSQRLSRHGFALAATDIIRLDEASAIVDTMVRLTKRPEISEQEQPTLLPRPAPLSVLVDYMSALNRAGVELVAPLTDLQGRMLRGSIARPGLNYIKVGIQYSTSLKAEFVCSAWSKILSKHSIFRTTFDWTIDDGVQVVWKNFRPSVELKPVSSDQWSTVAESLREDKIDPEEFPSVFDETSLDCLSRMKCLTSDEKPHLLVWTIHHSLIDGASVYELMNQVQHTLHGGQCSPVGVMSFCEYAQRDQTTRDQNMAKNHAFWSDLLAEQEACVVPRLLSDSAGARLPDEQQVYQQSSKDQTLKVAVDELRQGMMRLRTTAATLVYAAWSMVLSRYCGSAIFGAVSSGRDGFESVVGPLLKVSPLPITVREDQAVGDFLRHILDLASHVADMANVPNAIVHDSKGMQLTDFYNTIVSLQFDFDDEEGPQNHVERVDFVEPTEMPISLAFLREGRQASMRMTYLSSQIDEEYAQDIMNSFDEILWNLVRADEATLLSDLAPVSWNPRQSDEGEALREADLAGSSLWQAFLRMATMNAHEPALLLSDHVITYSQLLGRIRHLANALGDKISPGAIICIANDGTLEAIVAILSVLARGAAFCPVDTSLPDARMNFMLQKTGSQILLCSSSRILARQNISTEIIPVDALLQDVRKIGLDTPPLTPPAEAPNDHAAVVFTSGTTGAPKAIQLQHKGLLQLLSYEPIRFHSKPGVRIAQVMSLGFDGFILELFSALCFGGALVLRKPNDPYHHLSRANAAIITPVLLAALDPNDFPNLDTVIAGGDVLQDAVAARWSPGRRMYNAYGPTEITIACTLEEIRPDQTVTIGRPIPGTRVYILDGRQRAVPTGVVGELCVSGEQVTAGYLKPDDPSQNARFVADPFHPNKRMYCTGDRARWTRDGKIEFIGRADHQIKLRGFRIDVNDIESTISAADPSIKQVGVVTDDGALVAFVAPSGVDVVGLRHHLGQTLPHYSVPRDIIALDHLDLSINQKVDRKALQRRLVATPTRSTRNAGPLTDDEELVAEVWKRVLKLSAETHITPYDRLSQLGGHSIQQISVARALADHVDFHVALRKVFEHDQLRDFAKSLRLDPSSTPTARFSGFKDPIDLQAISHNEAEILSNLKGADPATFNMGVAVTIRPFSSMMLLKQSINLVAQQIGALSTYYMPSKALRHVRCTAFTTPRIRDVELRCADMLEDEVALEMNRPFNVARPPLWRAAFFEAKGADSYTMVITMSHLIGDGAVLSSMIERISQTYTMLSSGQSVSVGSVIQSDETFARWVAWEAAQRPQQGKLDFWRSHLQDIECQANSIFGRHGHRTFSGASRIRTVSSALATSMDDLCVRENVNKQHLMLLAVALALRSLHGLTGSVLLATPYANRSEPGTEDIGGLLLERLPVKINFDCTNKSIGEMLRSIRASSASSLENQLPFRLIAALQGGQDVHTMVTYHGHEQDVCRSLHETPGLDVSPVHIYPGGARFPLMVQCFESFDGGATRVQIEHDTGMLDAEGAHRFEEYLFRVLELLAFGASHGSAVELLESLK